ncbi:MAG: hypothetical protein QOJ40_706, partial [Verrucomicrobiota bacterium]
VAQATGGARGFLAAAEHRQEKCGQNRNDGDDHEQFDQGEGVKPESADIPAGA